MSHIVAIHDGSVNVVVSHFCPQIRSLRVACHHVSSLVLGAETGGRPAPVARRAIILPPAQTLLILQEHMR
jgi:hypothetical protein